MPITFVGTILILYLPYIVTAGSGVLVFLPRYLREEGLLSGGRYYLLDLSDRILDWLGVVHGVPSGVFTALVLAALGIVLVWAFLRNPSLSVSRPDQHLCWLHSGFVLALFLGNSFFLLSMVLCLAGFVSLLRPECGRFRADAQPDAALP